MSFPSPPSPVRESVRTGVIIEGVGKLLIVARHLVLLPVFLSCWGRSLYGEWVVLTSVAAFLELAGFGIGVASGNEMVAALERGKRRLAITIFWAGLIPLAVVSLAILAVGVAVACSRWDPRFLVAESIIGEQESRVVLGAAVIQVGGGVLGSIFAGGLNAYRGFNFTRAWGGIAQLVVIVAVVLALQGGLEPAALAILLGAFSWFFAFVSSIFLFAGRRELRTLPRKPCRSLAAAWKRLLSPSLGFFLSPLVSLLLLRAPNVLLGVYFGGSIVTGFSACRTLTNSLRQGVSLVSVPAWRAITAAAAVRNWSRVRRVMRLVVMATTLSTAVGALVLLLGFEWILDWWLGENFEVESWIFLGLLLSACVSILASLFGLYLFATNQNLQITIRVALWAILSMSAAWIALGMGGSSIWVVGGLVVSNLGAFCISLRGFLQVWKQTEVSAVSS
ncbi:MAG: hypothetical protein PVJ98_09905 [Akkermansiaceae bacterium]